MRLAIFAITGAANAVNAHLTLTSSWGPTVTYPAISLGKDKENDSNQLLLLAQQLAISSQIFPKFAELYLVSYITSWTVSTVTPLLNDLKFFGLLSARAPVFTKEKEYNQKLYKAQAWLNINSKTRYCTRAFWYHRNFIALDWQNQGFYILQLYWMQLLLDPWFAYLNTNWNHAKWSNAQILMNAPYAFAQILYIDTI